jgi:hypothetical protein
VSWLAATGVRRGLYALLFAAFLFIAVGIRVVSSAASELARGDRLKASGELEAAVIHYRRAARWYAPFSPFHVRALVRLGALGAEAERQKQPELALSAYRAVRASIISTRSLYLPEAARLRAADQRIASLMASQPPPPMDAGKPPEQLKREHLALLTADPDPKLTWTLVLLLGFVSWVAGAFAFTLRAIDDQDRFVPREVRRWGGVIALGFGLFVLGMSLA